jgi:hypothetical protein
VNQRLVGTPFASPVEVVERLGAVQAQDYSGAKWAVAQRTAGATDASLEALLTDGAIVRTHVLRPTWHFVAPSDLRWMLALTAPRVKQLMSSYNRKMELTDAVLRRSNAVIAKALAGGHQLTRGELAAALQRAKVDTSGTQRLAHLVMNAELDAVVCSSARRGKQFTYALFDERIPRSRSISRDEALAELATRYFSTRGPASAHDFSWWSGLTIGDAKRGAESASGLRAVTIEGRAHWSAADAEVPARVRSTHLLPNYDEYFVGYRDRSAMLQLVKDATPEERTSELFAHVIEIDGQLVGGWTRTTLAREVVVETSKLRPISTARMKAVAAEAARLGTFLGTTVKLVG